MKTKKRNVIILITATVIILAALYTALRFRCVYDIIDVNKNLCEGVGRSQRPANLNLMEG